jgi:hypothetical protein
MDAGMDSAMPCVIHPGPSADASVEAGAGYVGTRNCNGCHTQADAGILSGRLTTVGGNYAYPKNLTPDKDTGLGCWEDETIARAIRTGVDDQGATLCVMPKFGTMSDSEVYAIVAYLRSIPAVARDIPETACPVDGGADGGKDGSADSGH